MSTQNVTIQGTMVVSNDTQKYTALFSNSPTISGSHSIQSTQTIATSSWQVIDQNNNSTFGFGVFNNNGITSSLYIAIAGTASYASILRPGASCQLAYSGSPIIYAKASGSVEPVLCSYTLVEI